MITKRLCIAGVLLASMLKAAESPACAASVIEAVTKAGAIDAGRSTDERSVDFTVMMSYRDSAELERLVAAQTDPNSSDYHKFLTPEQFSENYAATQEDYDRVVDSMRRAGMAIMRSSVNRTTVHARGTASLVSAYFHTEIHELNYKGERYYGNTSPATVPEEIADVVSGVAGLTDLTGYHTMVRFPTSANIRPAATSVLGPDGGLSPQALARVYELPVLNGHTGKGHAAAILIDADFLDSDIDAFLKAFHIKRTGKIYRRPVDGGPAKGLTNDSVETELDVETIASLAPGADVYVYEGINFADTANTIDTYAAILRDNKVDTVNASLGYCEIGLGPIPKMIEQLAIHGSALGITFHASSGDEGSNAAYGCTGVSVNVPAAAPHVTAIGGTSLFLDDNNGDLVAEVGWTNPDPSKGASGGGVSTLFGLPSFQHGVRNVIGRGRNLPDISFDADPLSGASYYFNGAFAGPIGGTSLASPIFGAALLEINEERRSRGGFIAPEIYAAWKEEGYSRGETTYFRDIVAGSDGRGIGGGFILLDGYDQVTGIGAPVISNLVKGLSE